MLGLLLKAIDFDSDGGIVLDGDFAPGGEIEKALLEYQEVSNLKVTGVLDDATQAEFASDLGFEGQELAVEMFFAPASVPAQTA
jgi:hypothetical protein